MDLSAAKVQHTVHFICWFAQMYVTALLNHGANCEVHIFMTDERMSEEHR